MADSDRPYPPPDPGKFDAVAAWARLGPAAQAAIGAAALLLGYCGRAALHVDGAAAQPIEIAGQHAEALLHIAIIRCGVLPDLSGGRPPRPDLAVFGIRACSYCGCTDAHACLDGCAWVAPGVDVCTACARRAAAEDQEAGVPHG